MLKITNAFRWIYGIIFRKPTRFSWLIDRRLAGSDVPLTFSQYRWLLKQGIQTIVTVREKPLSSKWVNQNITTTTKNSGSGNKQNISNQSKICPNCGQENDRYGLPIYPFNKSTKVLDWCAKCLGTVQDITTVDGKLPPADNV